MRHALTGGPEDRDAIKAEKRQRLGEKEDIQAVLKIAAGRRVLMRILDELQPRRRKMTAQAAELYNFGMTLRDWLDDAVPLGYLRMVEEKIQNEMVEREVRKEPYEEGRQEEEGDEET